MNMDDVFGFFWRFGGSDCWWIIIYRLFFDWLGGECGGVFYYLLFIRLFVILGGGVIIVIVSSLLWFIIGSIVWDVEVMFGGIGGGVLDVIYFYMYDVFMIIEYIVEGFFGERGFGGVLFFLDFIMDLVYLMGRWGGRIESCLSSWIDDG